MRQSLTGCTLRAPRVVEGYNRSSQHISLVLWGFMHMVQECDARKSSHLIQCMARQFTAQLQGSLSKDNKSKSLHGSGTILCDGVFEQAPQTDAKYFCMERFLYSPGAENQCMVSIAVSLRNHLQTAEAIQSSCCN